MRFIQPKKTKSTKGHVGITRQNNRHREALRGVYRLHGRRSFIGIPE